MTKRRMELVSPAGNLEKLTYAWEYGADAAYIGLKDFSLRVKADNFHGDEHRDIRALKDSYARAGKPKRLFCAVNVACGDDDLDRFAREIDYFGAYPFDAFIVQDLGLARMIRERLPGATLHLSTQANCLNSEAVKTYRDLGFRRVVLAREARLDDVRRIKDSVPEMEIECFAHGAMCIAYSGRCLMSAYMTGRSANKGSCTHSCRWDWRVLEERERPGEYYPVVEGDDYTALFSSRDLCMIDHLAEMRDAGVDSLKIEGRMKSLYYVAVVSRAYRKALDALDGIIEAESAQPFIDELDNVPHRAYGTGFYFGDGSENLTTPGKSSSPRLMAGTIGARLTSIPRPSTESRQSTGSRQPSETRPSSVTSDWELLATNKIISGEPLEIVSPTEAFYPVESYELVDPDTGKALEWTSHHHRCAIRTATPLSERCIVRCASRTE